MAVQAGSGTVVFWPTTMSQVVPVRRQTYVGSPLAVGLPSASTYC